MEDSTSFLKTCLSSLPLLIQALLRRPTPYPSSLAFVGSHKNSVSPSLNHEKPDAPDSEFELRGYGQTGAAAAADAWDRYITLGEEND